MSASTGIMPRATVQTLVAQRNRVLASFETAHAALVAASEAVGSARKLLHTAAPATNSYNHYLDAEKVAFHSAATIPDLAEYMTTAKRIVDVEFWAHIVQFTDLERLMDKKAKDQLRQQLMTAPPEVTEATIFATLETFILDADTIFKRGIAECFSALDRRFKSHDGWDIGARVILTFAFDSYGSWNYHRNHRDSFADIERVFYVLDGQPIPPACQITQKLSEARGWGAQQTFIETEYFKVRAYKNGNAHIWFKRDDLLKRVNQLLGEYYGAPIPEEREAKADPLAEVKHTPAKHYGFFPTPDKAADIVMQHVPLYPRQDGRRLRVLEPSAGTGQLARRCAALGAIVDCVEIQHDLAQALGKSGRYNRVLCLDFLRMTTTHETLYDLIVMNPPFDRERDIDHVAHALTFLRPGGVLVAVMSAGTEFRTTKKSQAFRAMIEKMPYDQYDRAFSDLPALSFSEAGTNCNTIIVRVRKPAVAAIVEKAA